ncbi:MAG: ATP-binding protein [Candidatus Heimdallarchaeaceae archaeon]
MTESLKKDKSPYEKLAQHLNTIPNGFPETDDGSHIRLLEWIYDPDEAELASKLKLMGETIEKLAKRVRIPVDELLRRLDIMIAKGQVKVRHTKKGKTYASMPFVVGIYEEQVHRMDKEFAQLFENYLQKIEGDIIFSTTPTIHKVVPVNKVIKTELEIHPYNQAEGMIKSAKSWGIRDCICKKQKDLINEPCSYPISVCLVFSKRENAYEDSHQTETITMERSLEILKEAEEVGLVHSTMNVEEGHSYICNCCTCCCGVLRSVAEFNQPHAFVKSDYIMTVDVDACIGCGKCIERCQFDALELVDKKIQVKDTCVGCGVCALVCPKSALELEERNPKEIEKRSKNILWWMIKKAFSRRLNLLKVL